STQFSSRCLIHSTGWSGPEAHTAKQHSLQSGQEIGSPNRRASDNVKTRPVACATTTTLNTLAVLAAIPPLKSAAPHETAAERLRQGDMRFGTCHVCRNCRTAV